MALLFVVFTVMCHIAYAACANPYYMGVDSGCFRIVPNVGVSFSVAAAACASDGAQLASFQSAAEFVWATSYITANAPIDSVLWVGLTTTSATSTRSTAWSWSDGTSNAFLLSSAGQTWWLPSQPDGGEMCGDLWHSGESATVGSSTDWTRRLRLLLNVVGGCLDWLRMSNDSGHTNCNAVVKYISISKCDADYDTQ